MHHFSRLKRQNPAPSSAIAAFIVSLVVSLPHTSSAAPEANVPTPQQAAESANIYQSIVRIEAATQTPNFSEPWKAGGFSGGTGTGFLIGPNLFLTNAHVVSNAQRLLITIHGSPQKHPAKILHIAHDCDLALLQVDDFSYFEGLKHLAIGDVPKLESQVRVIGYPVGGNRISVTRGVVSRIDFSTYSHSLLDQHLSVQIDAAINPGNSGGPVLQDGKVVGVAFQGLRSADNTGYMIPPPVINRFLTDIKDGTYDKYVDIGMNEFPMFNPAMRKKFGLAPNAPGVLVARIIPESPCDGVLEINDIITAINGNTVDAAGKILIDGEKISMNEIVERKFSGDSIELSLIRGGQAMDKTCTLKPFPHAKIHTVQYETKPRYTTFAGLVFQPLSRNLYAAQKFQNTRVRKLYANYVRDALFKEREDLVILTRILNDPVNTYIGDFTGSVIESINGEKISSLQQAHELLHPEETPDFFVIRCEGNQRPIVIPGDKAATASARTEARYGISAPYYLEK